MRYLLSSLQEIEVLGNVASVYQKKNLERVILIFGVVALWSMLVLFALVIYTGIVCQLNRSEA